MVNMGYLNFELNKILLKVSKCELIYIICIEEYMVFSGVVFMGNLYCVLEVDDIYIVEVNILGLLFENYECFL